jgi:hypothetical protein
VLCVLSCGSLADLGYAMYWAGPPIDVGKTWTRVSLRYLEGTTCGLCGSVHGQRSGRIDARMG